MDHYEVRKWARLVPAHHITLALLAHLFLVVTPRPGQQHRPGKGAAAA